MRRVKFSITSLLMLVPLIAGLAVPAGAAAEEPAGAVEAAGYSVRYLARPNALPATNGIRLDGEGNLIITQNVFNRVERLDLRDRSLVRLADETDASPLTFPDDVAIDKATGNLFFSEPFGRSVTRTDPNGENRKTVATGITDGRTFPNGISFDRKGRLFVTDMNFDSSHPSGMWEIDPNGLVPPRPVVRDIPTPNGFDFGPDNLAYVTTVWSGKIYVVDVDADPPTHKVFAKGFGALTALKVDPKGRLVVVESDTGKVWRIDRTDPSRRPTLLAQGAPGLDNLDIDSDGTIYVSYFEGGNIGRVHEASGTIKLLFEQAPFSVPVSLNESADGSLLVGDFTSVARLAPDGTATRVHRAFSDKMLVSSGAAQLANSVYFTQFVPPRKARVCRLRNELCEETAPAALFPWHIRALPGGNLLLSDQGAGTVVQLDPATKLATPLAAGLATPGGLAYDSVTDTVYVSESGAGRVVAIERATGISRIVAEHLDTPEGVAVEGNHLLVVEGGGGRLLRIDPRTGERSVIASGLPTKAAGGLLGLMNYTSDVVVMSNGNIVVSGDADGSVIEFAKQ